MIYHDCFFDGVYIKELQELSPCNIHYYTSNMKKAKMVAERNYLKDQLTGACLIRDIDKTICFSRSLKLR